MHTRGDLPFIYSLTSQLPPPHAQQTALSLLQKQFPDSARVGRLKGMQREAEGDFEGAAAVYLNLRERYPTDPVSLLRSSSDNCQGEMFSSSLFLSRLIFIFFFSINV